MIAFILWFATQNLKLKLKIVAFPEFKPRKRNDQEYAFFLTLMRVALFYSFLVVGTSFSFFGSYHSSAKAFCTKAWPISLSMHDTSGYKSMAFDLSCEISK